MQSEREQDADGFEQMDESLLEKVLSATTQTQPKFETKRALAPGEKRNLRDVERALLQEAELAGERFYYGWGSGKDKIEGPSQILAHAAARCFGNCVIDNIPIQETETAWVMGARFVDLETGFTLTRLFRQSKKWKIHGKHDEERKEDMRFQIGQSKAARNVILKVMPEWLIEKALEKAKAGVRESIERLIESKGRATAQDVAVKALVKAGVPADHIFAKFGIVDAKGLDLDKLVRMKGDIYAIQNGHERAEVLYPDPKAVDTGDRKVGKTDKLPSEMKKEEAAKTEEPKTSNEDNPLGLQPGETVNDSGEIVSSPVEEKPASTAWKKQLLKEHVLSLGAKLKAKIGQLGIDGMELGQAYDRITGPDGTIKGLDAADCTKIRELCERVSKE